MATMTRARKGQLYQIFLPILLGFCGWGVGLCGTVSAATPPTWNQRIKADTDLLSRLAGTTLNLRNDGNTVDQRKLLGGGKAPAELHAIVVMCDFSDSLMLGRYGTVPGDFPLPRQSEIYYAAHDSVYFDHLLGDVTEYFRSISDGQFTFSVTILPQVVNLPEPMWFYGDHPDEGDQPVLLARDVVARLVDEIDFSSYDTMVLIHAGAGQETDILGDSPEQIFSTYLDPQDFSAAVEEGILTEPWLAGEDFGGNGGLDHVLLLPETEYQDPVGGYGGYFGSLGVYCFEVGLRLGMLSLSDFTPAGRPDSQGIGEFGLMGYGLFVGLGWIPPEPCAFNKVLMGWLEPQNVDPHLGGVYGVTPIENEIGPTPAVRVDISGQEYWLLEYRLQDPDANGIFSFSGDLNNDNIPDFFDADSELGNGIPTGFFDPETDTREQLTDAEWDFFMSENSARAPGVKGAGSGVYVWHVDEGVIRDVFNAESNLFNADATHKAVDLEEADGIQDLDSNIPSEFILGGDDDSFRGEGNHEFGPFTRPGTETATGAFTGVTIGDFSNVVADTVGGLVYADVIAFTVSMQNSGNSGPALAAKLTLPVGVDLRGSHVLVGDLDGGATTDEIILAGHAGEVYALDGDLHEYIDADGDPQTVVPLAIGTWGSEPVTWNLPPAMGDLDGDGLPEIILTASHGIYAFHGDGSPLVDGDENNFGLFQELPSCSLPPVLTPLNATSDWRNTVSQQVVVNVVIGENGRQYLRQYGASGDVAGADVELGAGRVVAPPVLDEGHFLVMARIDTSSVDPYQLDIVDLSIGGGGKMAAEHTAYPLLLEPGLWPVMTGIAEVDEQGEPLIYVMVPGADEEGETLFFRGLDSPSTAPVFWSREVTVDSPLAPGGGFVGLDLVARVGHGGDWLDGWPVRIEASGSIASSGGPLVSQLAGSDSQGSQTLFPLRDGRILALGAKGETCKGWPLAGPAICAGTPGLGNLRGGNRLDLVSVGTFDRITGLTGDAEALEGEPVSTIMVWEDVAEVEAAWPMYGGGIWRNGSYDRSAYTVLSPAESGRGLVSGSHSCYPNPLREGNLFVRGETRAPGRARAFVYNLEGELVVTSNWKNIVAGDPFSLEVSLGDAVTGMYFCRLAVETGGEAEFSVVTFAIVR